MSIEELLETLDEEQLLLKSNLVMQYKQQFALHGFHTINELVDTYV
jgi:hypothetical protein